MSKYENIQMDSKEVGGLSLSITLPFEVIDYLSNDNFYKNPHRLSKIEAFRDLMTRRRSSLIEKTTSEVNISQLAKSWCWSRPTVLGYVSTLLEMQVVNVTNSNGEKLVALKPELFGKE